jgi:hypothetical protein
MAALGGNNKPVKTEFSGRAAHESLALPFSAGHQERVAVGGIEKVAASFQIAFDEGKGIGIGNRSVKAGGTLGDLGDLEAGVRQRYPFHKDILATLVSFFG